MIIKVAKPPTFDLSFNNRVENTKIIVALESLKGNAGWQFLTQVLEKNIEYIQKCVMTKKDGEVKLEEKELDVMRDKYEYLKELLEKPDMFIKKLKGNDDTGDNGLDPYES